MESSLRALPLVHFLELFPGRRATEGWVQRTCALAHHCGQYNSKEMKELDCPLIIFSLLSWPLIKDIKETGTYGQDKRENKWTGDKFLIICKMRPMRRIKCDPKDWTLSTSWPISYKLSFPFSSFHSGLAQKIRN